jgi:hypothetical protein
VETYVNSGGLSSLEIRAAANQAPRPTSLLFYGYVSFKINQTHCGSSIASL